MILVAVQNALTTREGNLSNLINIHGTRLLTTEGQAEAKICPEKGHFHLLYM